MKGSAQTCFLVFSLSVTVLELGCPGLQTSQAPIWPKVKGRGVMTLADQVPQSTHDGPRGLQQPVLDGQGLLSNAPSIGE